jgi:hypothetical protein
MGLLEYQAMSSLRDVAHDSVLCIFTHLVIDQPQTRPSGVVRQGRRHRPSITYKITPCWVTLLQPARWAALLGQPLSFGLIEGHSQRKKSTLNGLVHLTPLGIPLMKLKFVVKLSQYS